MAEAEKEATVPDAGDGSDAVTKKALGEGLSAPQSNNKLVFIVLLVNAVVLMGLAAVVWMSHKKDTSQITLSDIAAEKEKADNEKGSEHGEEKHGGEKGKEGAAPESPFVKESFTVNLSGGRGSRFAKVDVEIEAKDAFVREEVNRLRPRIRDFILVVISSKTYEQIESTDGREFLREEIKNKINGYLTRGQIQNVFFTQFIIQ